MTDNYTSDLYISWDELQSYAQALARQVYQKVPYINKVLAVTRGGLFPAGIIARELNIRQVDAISVESYYEQSRNEPKIIKDCQEEFRDTVLVVDDLVDTGSTFGLLRKHIENAHFATIFAKPNGIKSVDSYFRDVPQSTWVRFPWDTTRQYSAPLIKDR
ncbi:MAG: xanthine phosphoribosyltransferase [Alphaproteobacteria bacterium]